MITPRLNRKLTLEEASRVPDGAGGYSETWVVLGTVWAEITAGTGRERAAETLTVSSIPLRIRLRAAPPGAASRPKPEQRFTAGARVYRILAVTEDDDNPQYLVCFAQEEVSA